MIRLNCTAALIAALALPTTVLAADEHQGTQNQDPIVMAAVGCHFEYAKSYASTTATATEIAEGASSQCKKELDAYEQHSLDLALAQGLPLSYAKESQKDLTAKFKDFCRSFTVDAVIKFRASAKSR